MKKLIIFLFVVFGLLCSCGNAEYYVSPYQTYYWNTHPVYWYSTTYYKPAPMVIYKRVPKRTPHKRIHR